MHFSKGSTLTWQTQDIFNIPAGFLLSFSLSFIPFQGNCKFYHLRLILPIAVLHLHGIVPYLLFYIWLLSLHIWDPSMLLPSCVSLQPHGLQHTRPLCPSPSPKVGLSSSPLHWWCHPAISSSDALFSFCPQLSLASGTFPMSQLFASDEQNTGVSASASVLPNSIQGWLRLRLIDLLSLVSKWLSVVFSNTTVWRHQFFDAPPSLGSVTTIHDHW